MKSQHKINIRIVRQGIFSEKEETIDLYDSKSDLFQKKNGSIVSADSTCKEFTTYVNGQKLYAQTVDSDLKDYVKTHGSGTLLEMIVGNETLYVAKTAGTSSTPFEKPKTELFRLTANTLRRIDSSVFEQKGGVVYICSGKGQGVSGSVGGNGYVQRLEVPKNLPDGIPIVFGVTFSAESSSNGTAGGTAYRRSFGCGRAGNTPYNECKDYGTASGSGSAGGAGGKNVQFQYGSAATVEGTIVCYGGGGGGGYGGAVSTYSSCRFSSVSDPCVYDNSWGTATASGGQGGLTGAGTGTRQGPSGRTGGAGLSYNTNDLNGVYPEWTGDACIIVYKYDE